MPVVDFDAKLVPIAWTDGSSRVQAAATIVARQALALPVEPIGREQLLDQLRGSVGRDDNWNALIAAVGMYFGDWDVVAAATGGAMLGARVAIKKTFAHDTRGFVRHVATAVRAKLPATHVLAALHEQRDRLFAHHTDASFDVRPIVIAAHVLARDLVAAPDPVMVAYRWLVGNDELELDRAATAPQAVADGEDARVKIFERWAPELLDEPIDAAIAAITGMPETWDRSNERKHLAFDDLAIRAFVARRPLFARWDVIVDPAVAAWLGAEPTPAHDQRFGDLRRIGSNPHAIKLDRGWDDAVKALASGTPDTVRALTGKGALGEFQPGKFFKDDARKLLRYLAAAIRSEAAPADVEPAWLDFLSRRSPATTPSIEGGELHWKHLLAIQSAITRRLGKAPRGEVGAALRRAITST